MISTCKTCGVRHFIADNLKKLDMPEVVGDRIDSYLESRGEKVRRVEVSERELLKNYLIEVDGEVRILSFYDQRFVGSRSKIYEKVEKIEFSHATFHVLNTSRHLFLTALCYV